MMLALALLAGGAQDATVAEDAPVVILGRKLGEWRGNYGSKGGKPRCVTSKSSGDKAIDAIACDTLAHCAPPFEARIIAAANKKLPVDTRKQMNDAINRDLIACLNPERERRIAALADARAAVQMSVPQ